MDGLRVVIDIVLWVGVALALAAMLVVLAEHRRDPRPGDRWLLASLGAFSISCVPIVSLGFDHLAHDNAYPWRIFPAAVVIIPALMARSISTLCGVRTTYHRICEALSLLLLVAVIIAPRFPGSRTPLPPWYIASGVVFVLAIIIALVASACSIHAVTGGQSRLIRTRGGAMFVALLAFGASYTMWLVAPTRPMALVTSVLLLISGVTLVIAMRAPRTIGAMLGRQPIDDVLDRIVALENVRCELPHLLRQAAAGIGLRGIAVLDAAGSVLEVTGASSLNGNACRASREHRIAARAGESSIVTWSTPLTPPLRAADRAQLSLLGTLVQMSVDRERVAAHERAAASTLVEANDLKDRFVALVSHELRTPLTSIIGLARTAHERWDELPAEQIREFQRLIAEQGERLAEIVEHLLLISAIESGAITTCHAQVDVAAMLDVAVHDAGIRHAVQVEIADGASSLVGDERLIREVVVNFLANAEKYAAPPFSISVCRRDSDVEIAVRDAGHGVPASVRDRLFERFVRDPANELPGSGLGLAIAHDLATAMDGAVGHRESSLGGSEFWLRIPLTPVT